MKRIYLTVLCSMLMASMCAGQVPRVISYQGLMLNKSTGAPVPDNNYPVVVKYYSSASGGTPILSETFQSVPFVKGVFDLFLGSHADPKTYQFPESMKFDVPYWIEIIFDPGAADETTFPRQSLLSAPYALNAERVGGIDVSPLPIDGDTTIFPLLFTNGRIDPSYLPTLSPSIQQINTVGPDANGTMQIQGGPGVTISNDPANHTITISGPTDTTMVAIGTTAQRPATPAQGMVRFNTTTSKFEGYDGSNWVNLN